MNFKFSKTVKAFNGAVANKLLPKSNVTTFVKACKPVKFVIVFPDNVSVVTESASAFKIFPFTPFVSIPRVINFCSKLVSGIAVV